MELKRVQKSGNFDSIELLIVPYGIETSFQVYTFFFCKLLIVPYGIET